MKIGIVIEQLDPARGGAEQWTWQFARWLAGAGHEVHVVARRLADATRIPGIHPHPLPDAGSRLCFAAAAESLLRTLPLDVVHDMGSGWSCDVFQPHGGARGASFRQNLLLAPRWLRPIRRRIAPWLPRYREFAEMARRQYASDGRLVIALSKMVAADLVTCHQVAPAQIRLVYNGVDTERFTPARRQTERMTVRASLGVSTDEILFLIVAHNFALKGVPTLIRAVGELAWERMPVRLVIAGGKHNRAARRLAARVGIRDRVTFLGSVPDAAPYYAAADVYVQPTYYDPCSLVVLEALAAGLPIVTSRYNGAAELITSGREGSIVDDPGDVGELAERLREYCDPARRERAGRAARQLAMAHSWERNCRQIVEIYEEIVAAGGRRARAAA